MAKEEPASEMKQKLVEYLSGGKSALVATLDEQGRPYTAIMSWVVAKDPKCIRIAMLTTAQSLRNIKNNGKIMLGVDGPGITYGIRGVARVVREEIEGAPLPIALVEMAVDYVKDDSVPGLVEVTSEINYKWAEGAEWMVEAEKQLFEQMKR